MVQESDLAEFFHLSLGSSRHHTLCYYRRRQILLSSQVGALSSCIRYLFCWFWGSTGVDEHFKGRYVLIVFSRVVVMAYSCSNRCIEVGTNYNDFDLGDLIKKVCNGLVKAIYSFVSVA